MPPSSWQRAKARKYRDSSKAVADREEVEREILERQKATNSAENCRSTNDSGEREEADGRPGNCLHRSRFASRDRRREPAQLPLPKLKQFTMNRLNDSPSFLLAEELLWKPPRPVSKANGTVNMAWEWAQRRR